MAFRELEGVFLIVPSSSGNMGDKILYYTLNEVAKDIWIGLDGSKTLHELEEDLLAIYDVGREEMVNDMRELLNDMEEKGVIVKVDNPNV